MAAAIEGEVVGSRIRNGKRDRREARGRGGGRHGRARIFHGCVGLGALGLSWTTRHWHMDPWVCRCVRAPWTAPRSKLPREKRIRLPLPPPMPAGVTRPTFTCGGRSLDGADTSSSGRAGMINSRDRPSHQRGLVVRRAMGAALKNCWQFYFIRSWGVGFLNGIEVGAWLREKRVAYRNCHVALPV